MKTFKRKYTVLLLATSLAIGTASATAATIKVTTGAFNGTKQAAKDILNQSSCSRITENKLIALMLSIPQWEIYPGDTSVARSPMTLSRYDGIGQRSDNINLYSNATYNSIKRAHWNPGVGMWQLDTWAPVKQMNHKERASTHTGGKPVAEALRDKYCQSDTAIKNFLNSNWFGCSDSGPNMCWNTFYNDIYNFSNDTLNVNLTSEYDWDGGVDNHLCRFGGNGASVFDCYWYNTNSAEGALDSVDPNGTGSRTPLAAGFITSTRSSVKQNTWLPNSNVGTLRIRKSVPLNSDPRNGSYWYNNTSMQIYVCSGGSCYWTNSGLVP